MAFNLAMESSCLNIGHTHKYVLQQKGYLTVCKVLPRAAGRRRSASLSSAFTRSYNGSNDDSALRDKAFNSMDFLDSAICSMDEALSYVDWPSAAATSQAAATPSAPAAALPSYPGGSTSSAAGESDSFEMAVQRWTRRLLTRRDFLHAHAASNIAFLVGGLALELITNAQWLTGERLQPWYPSHGYELLLMQAVIVVSAATGLSLTMSNRKGAEQTVFAAYGVQVLQGAALLLWMSPFLPQAMRDCPASDVAFGAFSIATSIAALAKLDSGKDEIMAGRNKHRGGDPASETKDSFVQQLMYWFPNLPGPAFTALAGVMQMHGGRAWVDAFSAAHPEYLAATLHIVLTTTLAGHCGMFAVTLRDKKLIGQDVEMGIAGSSNLMSLAYIVLLWIEYPWLLTHALLV